MNALANPIVRNVLLNLSRKRLVNGALYARNKYNAMRGRYNTLRGRYNAIPAGQRAMIGNVARQVRGRMARVNIKRRIRQAQIKRLPRRSRAVMTSRWAQRDIRILRKSSVVVQHMMSAIQSTDQQVTLQTAGAVTNDSTNYTPLPLKTIRTYHADQPWFFDVSDYIRRTAEPLLNADSKQSSVDIQSITFFMTFINYQPDVDMNVRTMLVHKKQNLQQYESKKNDVTSVSTTAPAKSWDDFWNDRVDKFEKHDFNTAFTVQDYSTNYKDYAQPNSSAYKIWKQKNLLIRSNPHTHGTQFTAGQNGSGGDINQSGTLEQHDPHMDADIQNDYAPNIVGVNGQGQTTYSTSHDMQVSRIRGYPGQNERQTVMTWAPKGGFRMAFEKLDKTNATPASEGWVPRQDLRFLMMPFEVTKDLQRKSTVHALGYRLEVTIKYKDLL